MQKAFFIIIFVLCNVMKIMHPFPSTPHLFVVIYNIKSLQNYTHFGFIFDKIRQRLKRCERVNHLSCDLQNMF